LQIRPTAYTLFPLPASTRPRWIPAAIASRADVRAGAQHRLFPRPVRSSASVALPLALYKYVYDYDYDYDYDRSLAMPSMYAMQISFSSIIRSRCMGSIRFIDCFLHLSLSFRPSYSSLQSWTWVGSIHGSGWVGSGWVGSGPVSKISNKYTIYTQTPIIRRL